MSLPEIPSTWIYTPLGEVCEIFSGAGFPEHLQGRKEGDYPFLKVSDISQAWKDGQTTITRGTHYLDAGEAARIRAKPLPTGSVIFAKIGEAIKLNRRAILGRPALVDNNVIGLFPKEQTLSSKYLFYWSLTLRLEKYSRATTVPSVRKTEVEEILIPLPPLPEQERIVAAVEKQLTRLDAATSTLKRAKANLKSYRASLLKAACEGRLVPTEAESTGRGGRDYEEAERIRHRILQERQQAFSGRRVRNLIPPTREQRLPEGWTWISLDELGFVGTGATPLRSDATYYLEGRIPWVTSSAVNSPYIRAASEFVTPKALQETNLTLYPKHTLLLAMYGEGKTRGKCSELLLEATTNQALAALVLNGTAALCRPYVKLFLQHSYEEVRRLSSGGVQPNLNLDLIRRLSVPLPPLAEQERIVTEVDRRLSVIAVIDEMIAAHLQKTENLRQSLLKEAFLGRLVPQDQADEPASVLLERIRQERAQQSGTKSRRGRPPRAAPPNPQKSRPSGAVEFVGSPPGAHAPPLRGSEEVAAEGPELVDLPRSEQIDAVWEALLGQGAIEKDEAVRVAAEGLRARGMAKFQRLRRGGPLYEAIQKAIEAGVRKGSFDRPARGQVRAVLREPRGYTPETWQQCLLGVLDHQAMDQAEALRAAAEWARENLGLEFARLREDGIILGGLREALKEAVRAGTVKKTRSGHIQRVGDS